LRSTLKKLGKMMVAMLFGESLTTFIFVTFCMYIWLKEINIALLFGALSSATAPTATMAAIHDCRAKGPLTTLTIVIVGLDDGICILLFAFAISFIKVSLGGTVSFIDTIIPPLREIFGAVALGVGIGVALSLSVKYIRGREETLITVIACLLLCSGLAQILDVSLILACMMLGTVFANLSPAVGKTSYETLEEIIPTIYIAFFAIAGLRLRVDLLLSMGMFSVIYILCRILGKWGGTTLTCKAVKAEPKIQKYLGFTLLSQAGVAIGLACLACTELSPYPGGKELGALAITIITASTVVFEIIGPIGIRFAVTKAGESG